jgi:hypothetical protein
MGLKANSRSPTSPVRSRCSSVPAPTRASKTCAPRRCRQGPQSRLDRQAGDRGAGFGPGQGQAEAEGLDKIFLEAGFEWREPGCSMCLAMNADRLESGRALRLDLQP